MSAGYVAVPVPIHQFSELVRFLDAKKAHRDPVQATSDAISYWMDNADWKPDLIERSSSGYWWKSLFVPTGAKARMNYKGKMFQGEVSERGIEYSDKTLSPAEFTLEVTGTSRNAWRDIEFLFPGSSEWKLADNLR